MMTQKKRYDNAEIWKECACGCGKPILKTSIKQKYYKPACRVRAARDRRAKGIPAKKQNRNDGDKPKSPEEQELDDLEDHFWRTMARKGRILVCRRCGVWHVLRADEPGGEYCHWCTSVLGLEDDGHA
jgi:hypothetical protein